MSFHQHYLIYSFYLEIAHFEIAHRSMFVNEDQVLERARPNIVIHIISPVFEAVKAEYLNCLNTAATWEKVFFVIRPIFICVDMTKFQSLDSGCDRYEVSIYDIPMLTKSVFRFSHTSAISVGILVYIQGDSLVHSVVSSFPTSMHYRRDN